jgi:hypothetical protein
MKIRQIVAAALVAVTASAPAGLIAAPQGNGALAGTAKDEAKKPYADYSARARDVQQGQIVGKTPLDTNGNFSLNGLAMTNLLVELVDKNGKVVCTEGPFDLAKQSQKSDVVVKCDKVPAAWWLVGAAAAAGITAGVTSGSSPQANPTVSVGTTSAGPASAAR